MLPLVRVVAVLALIITVKGTQHQRMQEKIDGQLIKLQIHR